MYTEKGHFRITFPVTVRNVLKINLHFPIFQVSPEAETMLLSLKPNRVNKLKHAELSNRHPSAEWQRQTSFPQHKNESNFNNIFMHSQPVHTNTACVMERHTAH